MAHSRMDPDRLRSRVQEFNSSFYFENPLNYDKLAEIALQMSESKNEEIFKQMEENKDTVKDPTAWVTSALRKAAAASAKGGGKGGGDGDGQLRKRIGWLNGDGGGYKGAIIYDKVVSAAGGLPYEKVMRVLKDLEDKSDVKDPTAWVCNALRKAGGGNPQDALAWAPLPTAWAPPPAAWGAPVDAGPWAAAPPSGGFDAGADSKIRKRVQWLNTTGGFANSIDAQKVSEAAAGHPDLKDVMKVLKDVEEKKDQVKDANAYVCAALRKQGGGAKGGGGGKGGKGGKGGDWGAPPMHAMGGGDWGGPPMHAAWSGSPPASDWAPDGTSIQGEDAKLRKRIGWLNKQGGFAGAIVYDKILGAAGGLEFAEVFRQLQQLEEKGAGAIKDPTAWVCHGLRRAAAEEGPASPPVHYGGGPPVHYGGGPPAHYGGGYAGGWEAPPSQWSGPSPMDVDASISKLRKRVEWLNENEGFDEPLDFKKVSEAAVGLDSFMQMKILKDLQERKAEVKNPTSYVTAAYRKVGGGGGKGKGKGGGKAGDKGNGVRRTIDKNLH